MILDETEQSRRNAVKSMIFEFVRKSQSQVSLNQSHFGDEILRLWWDWENNICLRFLNVFFYRNIEYLQCILNLSLIHVLVIHAKQFSADGNLKAIGSWYASMGADIGDKVRVTWISPTNIEIEILWQQNDNTISRKSAQQMEIRQNSLVSITKTNDKHHKTTLQRGVWIIHTAKWN